MLPWYVAHIEPARDTYVAKEFRRLGCEVYNPRLIEYHWGRKASYIERDDALFPGYLFFRAGTAEHIPWQRIDETNHVVRVLSLNGAPATIGDPEIERIRRFLEEVAAPPKRREFQLGTRLRVTDGPFAGLEGPYLGTVGERVTLLLDILGRGVVAEVSDTSLAVVA